MSDGVSGAGLTTVPRWVYVASEEPPAAGASWLRFARRMRLITIRRRHRYRRRG